MARKLTTVWVIVYTPSRNFRYPESPTGDMNPLWTTKKEALAELRREKSILERQYYKVVKFVRGDL